jgi:ABC-type nitrate/sulfonate/bicarbonate transport system permease component
MDRAARVLDRVGPPLVLVAVLVVAWEAYVRVAELNAITAPPPSRVLAVLWEFRDDALRHAVPTLVEVAVGLAVSVTLAIAAAAAMDRVAIVRRAVEPLAIASQAIPVLAIAPLLIIWFGFGLAPKIVIVVLVTFFPMLVALLDGFRRVPPEGDDLMRSVGASAGQTFRMLRWPSALPSFFTGLRLAAVYAVIGAIFGEYVGSREGLGIWMRLSQALFRTDLVFAAILISATVSMLLYAAVAVLERLLVPWAPAVRRARAGRA